MRQKLRAEHLAALAGLAGMLHRVADDSAQRADPAEVARVLREDLLVARADSD